MNAPTNAPFSEVIVVLFFDGHLNSSHGEVISHISLQTDSILVRAGVCVMEVVQVAGSGPETKKGMIFSSTLLCHKRHAPLYPVTERGYPSWKTKMTQMY